MTGLLNKEIEFKKDPTPEEMLKLGWVSQKGYEKLLAHRKANKEKYGGD